MGKKEREWNLDIGVVNTWSAGGRVIGLLPNIEYVENSFNRGITITLFGIGVFIGYINRKEIEKLNEQE